MEVWGVATPDFFINTSLITVEADVATTPKTSFGSGQLVGIFNIQYTNKGTVMIRVLNDTELQLWNTDHQSLIPINQSIKYLIWN